ncbi:hypothetical protein ACFWNC_14760 [Streptomyces sp. NPDC058369]|uniref:hypothetical protein n=1 Tax=Streptomyces sp. NPDC058369 TaxID=3346462 RepID=UPI00364E3310
MTEEIDWEPLIETAGRVARQITEKWSVVEYDDVKQEICYYLVENLQSLRPRITDGDFIYSVCMVVGKRYASKERNHYDLHDDEYWYTPDEVRIALKSFVHSDEEIGKVIGKKDDLTNAYISDNIVTARLDATRALGKLTKSQHEAVYRLFVFGLPATDETQRRAAYRAVDNLTKYMNWNVRTGR